MKRLLLVFIVIIYSCNCTIEESHNYETKVLLKSVDTNIMGEKFNYPDSNEAITTTVRVLRSGESTGLHVHEALCI